MKLIKAAFFCILGLVACNVFSVAIADSLSSSFLRCSEELNSTARLQCYDELSKSLKPAKEVKAEQTVTSQQQVKTLPLQVELKKEPASVEGFGLPDKPEPKEEIEKILAQVTNVDKDPFNKLIVSLDLGQIWQQIDDSRMRVREGDSVSLERGALGSFLLGVVGKSKRMRVKRIK
tara:strand:- start:2595 stop:3122 length:528 start_codon:yes stop_codon:yes gene_type:complete